MNSLANFILNEVVPRAKNLKVSPTDFLSPAATAFLWQLESDGILRRGQTRKLLESRKQEFIEGKVCE